MNDFTKYELIDLFDCCKAAYISGEINPQKPLQLKSKVQAMIDNYCEHDWRKGVHLFNDIYCTKCQKHFEVNNEQ